MNKDTFTSWRVNFFTGLAIVLPAVVSVAVIFWLFFTISNITDTLLVFIPRDITHKTGAEGAGTGPMYWYWSVAALIVAALLTMIVGLLARNFLGRKIIQWVDASLLKVPLLNKVYGAIKQVNEAFTSGGDGSFKTVVMIEYPRAGSYTLGFLTSEEHDGLVGKDGENLVCVFVPTTPNPTGGFLLLLPPGQVRKLDMSVADGIKFIISLGSISPDAPPSPLPGARPLS